MSEPPLRDGESLRRASSLSNDNHNDSVPDKATQVSREQQAADRAEQQQEVRTIKPLGTSKRSVRQTKPALNELTGSSSTGDASSSAFHLDSVSPRSFSTTNPSNARPSRSVSATPYASAADHSAATERRLWFPYPSNATSNTVASRFPAGRSYATFVSRPYDASNVTTTSPDDFETFSLTTPIDLQSLRLRRRASSAEPQERSRLLSRSESLSYTTMLASGMHDGATRNEEQQAKDVPRHALHDQHQDNVGQPSTYDEQKERAHFQSVLKAFDAYLTFSLAANHTRRKSFYALPRTHRLLLSSLGATLPGPLMDNDDSTGDASAAVPGGRGFKARLDEIDDRIRRNADVLSQIVADSRGFLGDDGEVDQKDVPATNPVRENRGQHKASLSTSTESDARSSSNGGGSQHDGERRAVHRDVDKVRSTIKQFVRDWSTLGVMERRAAYDPILEALESSFQHIPTSQRRQIRVLVPGAGLGRLAFEVAWKGFSCQGNEFSFYMLLASHFILNKTTRVNEHTVYPYVHSSSNWRTAEDLLRGVRMPDVNPSDLPSHVDFSMVAGEFCEVYAKQQEKAAWNAICTCFFIDTARNFARYVEVINHALPVGGVWINVGPLLWHFEASAGQSVYGDVSIELTLDEVMDLIELMGFEVERRQTLLPQSYTGNAHSMLTYEYAPEFWQARKVRDITPAPSV